MKNLSVNPEKIWVLLVFMTIIFIQVITSVDNGIAPDSVIQYSISQSQDTNIYNMSEGEVISWQLNYHETQGTYATFNEIWIKANFITTITEVSDQDVKGNLSIIMIEGNKSLLEKKGGYLKLFSFLSEELKDLSLSVNFSFEGLESIQYELPSAFIFPVNDIYWNEIRITYTTTSPPNGNRSFDDTLGLYSLIEYSDMTPVDGCLSISSLDINADKGYLKNFALELSCYYTLNPPYHSNFTLMIIDNPFPTLSQPSITITSDTSLSKTSTMGITLGWNFTLSLLSIIVVLGLKQRTK